MPDCNPFVMTPYYRTFVTLNGRDEAQEYDTNYTPYNIFCLSTRVGRDLARLGVKDYPVFIGEPINGKMAIVVKLLRVDHHVDLSPDEMKDLQKMVDRALSDHPQHCVLFSLDTMRYPYPRAWMMSIFPYLSVPAEYNPYIDENSIYVEFQEMSYKSEYDDLTMSILEQMRDLYTVGSVICNQSLARKWNLSLMPSLPKERITTRDIIEYAVKNQTDADEAEFELERGLEIDDEADQTAAERSNNTGLYLARWKDRRFAPDLSKFLLERVNGSETIEINVGLNFVVRHAIAKLLNQHFSEIIPLFSADRVILPAEDLTTARVLASLVEEAQRTANGKALFFPVTRDDLVDDFRSAAENLFGPGESETLFYQVDDPTRPVMISIEVPYSTDVLQATIELQQMVRPEKMK